MTVASRVRLFSGKMDRIWLSIVLALVFATPARAQSQGDLRLVDSSGFTGGSSGRVEIFISGQWGTICDDGVGLTEANVICRQLGYVSASSFGNTLFSVPSTSRPIWLDELDCSSFDTDVLDDCSHLSVGSNNCGHSEDLLVRCTNSVNSGSGELRLVQGSSTSSSFTAGRLEVFLNGQWGTICNDNFFSTEASVACRQLGYTSALQYGTDLGFGSGSSFQSIWLDNVDCSSFDSNLVDDCSHNTIGVNDCSHSDDIMINCGSSFIDATGNGELRLVQNGVTSSSFTAGRLEVFLNGVWGTVCDDGFFSTEANVACRQLGYTSALQYGTNLGFGSGSSFQSIWLDNVDCSSFDSNLVDDCSHNTIGVNDCSHSDDIMINCGSSFIDTSGFTNIVGVIVGSVVGVTVLIIIVVVACIFGCVCCGVCAASSATRSHRTAPPTVVTGYTANTATVMTVTSSQQNQQAVGAPAQQPPPTAYYPSQPVQGYGYDPNTNPKAEFSSSQAPPPYDAAQQYPVQQQQQPYYPQEQAYPPDQQQYPPPPNQAPYPTDQLQAAAPYPVAGDPAYPPAAGYPVEGYPQQ